VLSSKEWAGKASALAAGLMIVTGAAVPAATPAPVTNEPIAITEYHASIVPILETHCYECHGDGYDKGKVAFDRLETNAAILNADLWLRVLNNTRAGLMPAEHKPRVPAAEQAMLERWIKNRVFDIDARNPDPGRVTLRRLNRVEYRNTIRDLLGVDFNTEVEFPPDDSGFGFDNIGDALTLSPMLLEKYVAAAQTIIAEAVPIVSRKVDFQSLPGTAFTGTSGVLKDGKVRISYYDATKGSAKVKVATPGTYEVVLEVGVRGMFEFDPGSTQLVYKIDGKEVANQNFVYFSDKTFKLPSQQQWQAGEHVLEVALTPTGDPAKKLKGIDFTLNKITVEGPTEKDRWVRPPNHERFFPKAIPSQRAARLAYARELLGKFAAEAYRRPLAANDDTPARLAKLAESVYTQKGKTFEAGVAHAMVAVIASPRFLFRIEEPAGNPGTARFAAVDEYSLAARLSYFLWSTMPDAELMNLAAKGQLRANLKPQVARMLADPRAEQLAKNFTGQWLQSRDVESISSNTVIIIARDNGDEPDLLKLREAFEAGDKATVEKLRPKFFPPKVQLDAELRAAMKRETELFFSHIVREDRPITDFLDSDYTYANEKLAKFYGIPNVTGGDMRKIPLPVGSPRGGVLTQASSLIVTSNPDRTSPVKRGLFVLANILGTPPPPPPANVPALEASETEGKGHESTLRDVLKVHRENPACKSCHNRMDPIGLAFENFNALGMWRESERKQTIEASGELITGEKFKSVAELKQTLVKDHRQEFYNTLASKLLTYATGRGTEYYDTETLDQIVAALNANDGKFSTLLMGVVESAPFQKMRTNATATAAN
jgi:hypothetical protein